MENYSQHGWGLLFCHEYPTQMRKVWFWIKIVRPEEGGEVAVWLWEEIFFKISSTMSLKKEIIVVLAQSMPFCTNLPTLWEAEDE